MRIFKVNTDKLERVYRKPGNNKMPITDFGI